MSWGSPVAEALGLDATTMPLLGPIFTSVDMGWARAVGLEGLVPILSSSSPWIASPPHSGPSVLVALMHAEAYSKLST